MEQFFTIHKEVLNRPSHLFTAARVWNADETAITAVQKPRKIVATKGARQVSRITSAEKGRTVTVMCAQNPCTNYVPPFFIWPRKKMKLSLMNGAPAGSVGTASPSGWMDGELFMQWLKHFVDNTAAARRLNPASSSLMGIIATKPWRLSAMHETTASP